jgi:hypothetical protein
MSCFVVSNFDIDILLTAYSHLGAGAAFVNLTAMGRELLTENVKSFAACYRVRTRAKGCDMRNETARGYRQARAYRFKRRRAKPAAIAKLAQCYDYQACEHDGYDASTAKAVIAMLEARYPETLPGFEAMPWGISSAYDLMQAGCKVQVDERGKVVR